MIGSPGAGKSMLAARLPSILPPLSPAELLEVSMIASVAGEIEGGALTARRPFRSPHHSASMAALTGGGMRAKTRRDLAGASGRAVSRRIAGVRSAGAGFAAPADGERRGRGIPRQPSRHLSGALHAGRGDESLPLRPCLRARLFLQARPHRPLHRRLSGAHFRAADGPHRPAHRGAGGDRRRSDPAAARRRIGGSGRARGGGARPSDWRAMPRPDCPASAPMPKRRRRCWRPSRSPTRKASNCCAMPPRPCGCRRAAIIACLRVARTLADLDGADKIGRLHLAEALSYRALAEDLRRAA